MKKLTHLSRASFTPQIAATVIAGLLALAPARAEDAIRYKASPIGSKAKIAGSSNIHDWAMEGGIIGGWLEVPAAAALDPDKADAAGLQDGKLPAHADVLIPVTSLASGTEGMDEVMRAAMDEPNFHRIEYHLKEMTLKGKHAAGTPLEFETKGDLVIKGVTNAITMPVRIENATTKNKLKVTGSVGLKMTDYKVEPPVKLGIFKTVDDLKVSFEWIISKPAAKP